MCVWPFVERVARARSETGSSDERTAYGSKRSFKGLTSLKLSERETGA